MQDLRIDDLRYEVLIHLFPKCLCQEQEIPLYGFVDRCRKYPAFSQTQFNSFEIEIFPYGHGFQKCM